LKVEVKMGDAKGGKRKGKEWKYGWLFLVVIPLNIVFEQGVYGV
jgi:hypothetical protein